MKFQSGDWIIYTDEVKQNRKTQKGGYTGKLLSPVQLMWFKQEKGRMNFFTDVVELQDVSPEDFRKATEIEIQEEIENRTLRVGDWVAIKRGYVQVGYNIEKGEPTSAFLSQPRKIIAKWGSLGNILEFENGEKHRIIEKKGLRKATKREMDKTKLKKMFAGT